jgi:L-asparaginase II
MSQSFVVPPAPALLMAVLRAGRVESAHYGHLVAVTPEGETLASFGDPGFPFYARSTMKPVQLLPLLLSGAADAYALPEACLAVAAGSHAGQDIHVAAVDELLERAGVSADALQCGTHAPLHEPTAQALIREGRSPDVRQCNCSGKHAAMLAVCRHEGWDLATYRSPDHPLQQWIRSLIAELADLPAEALAFGVDGCGVPVWHLPLDRLARIFARLTSPTGLRAELRPAAERVVAAMTARPELVSGPGRVDTELMIAGLGGLVAKIGGEGVHAGGVRGAGIGWAMKVVDGNRRAIAPALAAMLAALGRPVAVHEALQTHVAPVVKNNRGEIVGVGVAAL